MNWWLLLATCTYLVKTQPNNSSTKRGYYQILDTPTESPLLILLGEAVS